MDKYVWIVMGYTGEWDDHRNWIVGAFDSPKKADDYKHKLDAEYSKFNEKTDKGHGGFWGASTWEAPLLFGFQRVTTDREELEKTMTKLHKDFEEDYTGTNWYVETVTYLE